MMDGQVTVKRNHDLRKGSQATCWIGCPQKKFPAIQIPWVLAFGSVVIISVPVNTLTLSLLLFLSLDIAVIVLLCREVSEQVSWKKFAVAR
jgi:hypothetical protein